MFAQLTQAPDRIVNLDGCEPTLLAGGARRIVHVVSKNLRERVESGTRPPLVGVRPFDHPECVELYRHAEILGPCGLWDTETPLPDTGGRGVCYVVTDAPIRVWRGPAVKRLASDREAAAVAGGGSS